MVALCPTLEATIYRPRRPRASPLWNCLQEHFDQFRAEYPDRYEAKCGPLRPVVDDVVQRFALR